MKNLESILGKPASQLLDPQYAVTVIKHRGSVKWLLIDRENLVLDFSKWRNEFINEGHSVPELSLVATQRANIAVLDERTIANFLASPEAHLLDAQFLKQSLIELFPAAQSWWDVEFLFPIAFIDFDDKRLSCFYHTGPKLERYIPDGWTSEFADFANTLPEETFPAEDKFWIINGADLLNELNIRGRALEENRPLNQASSEN